MVNTWDDEERYWRTAYLTRPYASGTAYDVLAPGYRYGYEAARRLPVTSWYELESELEHDWENCDYRGQSTWDQVKAAVRDAWERVTERERPVSKVASTGRYLAGGSGSEAPWSGEEESPSWQRTSVSLLSGAALGAALAYVLDPNAGRRRRARMSDAVTSATRRTGRTLRSKGRHLSNRARGLQAETTRALRREHWMNWSPSTCALVGGAGTALAGWGFKRHDPTGVLVGTVGAVLAAGAAASLSGTGSAQPA
jgi:hypothetical protein